MACIDKTYSNSWEEYQEVVKWCKENTFTAPNGVVFKPINSVYTWWDKDSFDGSYIPIMNTSSDLDYFLIKYCPIKLIQDRLEEVYDSEYIESIKNGTSKWDTFVYPETGTKVKLIKDSIYHNRKPFKHIYCSRKVHSSVFINVFYNDESLFYNEDYDKFFLPYELGITYSSCAAKRLKSYKAIVRKIRKWNLPKGSEVTVQGRYVGETWKFRIS